MKNLVDRRRWLSGLVRSAALGLSAPALWSVAGCGETEEDAPEPTSLLRVSVAEIPADGRLEREHLGVAVEFRREGDTIVALSMLCSHQMCRIEWQPEDRRYLCPCHDGLFDASGDVIYGPPKRPLRRLTLRREGDAVVVDVHEVYRAVEPSQPG